MATGGFFFVSSIPTTRSKFSNSDADLFGMSILVRGLMLPPYYHDPESANMLILVRHFTALYATTLYI
jgi:hypothetical protein